MNNIDSNVGSIKNLLNILNICFGPRGTILTLQNNVGGPLLLSRCCQLVTKNMSSHNTFLKLILTVIQQHQAQITDGSCLLGTIICHIYTTYIMNFSHVHPRLFSNVLKWCMDVSLKYMCLPEKLLDFEITIPHIMKVVSSVVYAKLTPLALRFDYINELSRKISEYFILVDGQINPMSLEITLRERMPTSVTLLSGISLDSQHSSINLPEGEYKAVLVTCSLSGDTDESLDVKYESDMSSSLLEEVLLNRLLDLITFLHGAHKIEILLCQKVIHPVIKQRLYSLSIHYQERLGEGPVNRFIHMAGCKPITSITEAHRADDNLTASIRCKHLVSGQNTDLLLTAVHPSSLVYTIFICHWSSHILNDIKAVVQQSVQVLQTAMMGSKLLPGAGLWQRDTADFVLDKSFSVTAEEVKKMGASTGIFREIVKSYCDILLKIARHLQPTHKSLISDLVLDSSASHPHHTHDLFPKRTSQAASVTQTVNQSKLGPSRFNQLEKGSHNLTIDDVDAVDVQVNQVQSLKTAVETISSLLCIGNIIECVD